VPPPPDNLELSTAKPALRRPVIAALTVCGYLPKAVVETTKPASYAVLMSGTTA